MPDYNESAVSGTSWQRCCQVVIENSRSTTPVVRFDEEVITALSNGTELRRPVGSLALPFDPAKTIDMRNPATGATTGMTMSYGEIYAVIYSAYLAAALERDTPPAPPANLIGA